MWLIVTIVFILCVTCYTHFPKSRLLFMYRHKLYEVNRSINHEIMSMKVNPPQNIKDAIVFREILKHIKNGHYIEEKPICNTVNLYRDYMDVLTSEKFLLSLYTTRQRLRDNMSFRVLNTIFPISITPYNSIFGYWTGSDYNNRMELVTFMIQEIDRYIHENT